MHTQAVMAGELEKRTRRNFIVVLWIIVAVVYFSFFRQWIAVRTNDKLFANYFSHVIQVSASEQRPAREIRALILVKAEELSIPIQGDQIHITGAGQTLRATVHYDAEITVPIVNRSVHRIGFDHDLAYQSFR